MSSHADIIHRNDHVAVDSDYDQGFVEAARDLDGSWTGDVWKFDPDQTEDVDEIVDAHYDDVRRGAHLRDGQWVRIEQTYECGHALGVSYYVGDDAATLSTGHSRGSGVCERIYCGDGAARLVGPQDMNDRDVVEAVASQIGTPLQGDSPDRELPDFQGTDAQIEYAEDVRDGLSVCAMADKIRQGVRDDLQRAEEAAQDGYDYVPEGLRADDPSTWGELEDQIRRHLAAAQALETCSDAGWFLDQKRQLQKLQRHCIEGDKAVTYMGYLRRFSRQAVDAGYGDDVDLDAFAETIESADAPNESEQSSENDEPVEIKSIDDVEEGDIVLSGSGLEWKVVEVDSEMSFGSVPEMVVRVCPDQPGVSGDAQLSRDEGDEETIKKGNLDGWKKK